MSRYRIYLSPPDVGDLERALLLDAFDSNWIAPLGPHVDAFEAELAARTGVAHAVALSSGSAALHLALILHGVGPGDDVLLPTLTFAATAFAVEQAGARPVFVDADPSTWQMDPTLVAEELDRRAARDELPACVVSVDLYGQCCDYEPILDACRRYEVPLIEDSAEALGATYRSSEAGSFGEVGVFSFNGNKIITTSGGGMLVTDDEDLAEQARHLATQAREPVPHYEHHRIGYNYRLSNLLAALGRGQLRGLDGKIARRREINAAYRRELSDLPGLEFMPQAAYGTPNWWLTCVTVEPEVAGTDAASIRAILGAEGIESRPVWKPMHQQPVFAGHESLGGRVAGRLFERGLCLPSGSALTDDELFEIADHVTRAFERT